MSNSEAENRPAIEPRWQQKGLNSRTSMFGSCASARSSASVCAVYRSSTSRRTRTPRAAASRSARSSSRPLASFSIT